MFSLFSKQQHQPTTIAYKILQQKQYHNIYYDPLLIQSLKADHKKLLKLYTKISYATDQKNFNRVEVLMKKLSLQLKKHLLKENSKLYIYLKYTLQDNQEDTEIFKKYEKEIRLTGRVLNDFVSRYSQPFLYEKERTDFAAQLISIGYVLTKRIDNEERFLYPLYRP